MTAPKLTKAQRETSIWQRANRAPEAKHAIINRKAVLTEDDCFFYPWFPTDAGRAALKDGAK